MARTPFKLKTPFKKGKLAAFWKKVKHQFTPQTRQNLNLGRDKDGKIVGSITPRKNR